ncbi:nuclear transport factor 2 family protein [Actinomadura madurae]|uniref:nuclear transport factor 2 family protein n=1 Tax=Actinomadura madurae TaxID=1993 RepID=UPI003556A924
MPTQEHMKQVLQTYIDAFNAGDAAAISGLYAEDAVIEDPVGNPPMSGRAAIEEFYTNAIAGRRQAQPGRPHPRLPRRPRRDGLHHRRPRHADPRHRRHDLRRRRQDRPDGRPLGPGRHREDLIGTSRPHGRVGRCPCSMSSPAAAVPPRTSPRSSKGSARTAGRCASSPPRPA